MNTMSDLNKNKLFLVVSVMVSFTIVTAIKDNDWVGYLLSLIIFPIFTWVFVTVLYKYGMVDHGGNNIKIITRKGLPLYVKEMKLGELDKTKCSPKFLTHNLPDDTIVNVKCHEDGTLDLRGKKGEYRIIMEDNV